MNPKHITIHCSATKPKHNYSVEKLHNDHVVENGWTAIGYHFYITTDGKLNPCRPLNRTGAHVKGFNTDNIGVCLEGGLNNDSGKPDDTYTHNQKEALKDIVEYLQDSFGIDDANVKGHRDWSPDLNGDGTIQANERIKECPCFDVKKWMENK